LGNYYPVVILYVPRYVVRLNKIQLNSILLTIQVFCPRAERMTAVVFELGISQNERRNVCLLLFTR